MEEVGPGTEMAIQSTQGPSPGRGRKEAWWEEGAGEAESAASCNSLERNGDKT